MKRAVFIFIGLLVYLCQTGCILEEHHFAIGPAGIPIIHRCQQDINYCGAACLEMQLLFHGINPSSQDQIMYWADMNGTGRLSLTEMRDYLRWYHNLQFEIYEYDPQGIVTEQVANNFATGLAACNLQGVAPIVPIYDNHVVIVAGYTWMSDGVTGLLIADPAMLDYGRDKYILAGNLKFAQAAFSNIYYSFRILADSVSVTIFNVLPAKNGGGIYNNLFAEDVEPTEWIYSDQTNDPGCPAWENDIGGSDNPVIPDSVAEIHTKALQALMRTLNSGLMTDQYVRNRYGVLYDNTFFGDPIYTSSQNVWEIPKYRLGK